MLSLEVLATWMIRVSERYFSLLYDRMHQKLLESRLVHCDETPFVVVQNGKSSGTKAYMWVYHTGPEHGSPPVYLYQYSPTRKTENPRNFLKGYCEILVIDGYQVYHALEKEPSGPRKASGGGLFRMGKGTDAENGSLLGYRQGAELQSESGAVSSYLPGERRSPAGQQRCGTEYQKILCREKELADLGYKEWSGSQWDSVQHRGNSPRERIASLLLFQTCAGNNDSAHG